jgi:hypothetical protein
VSFILVQHCIQCHEHVAVLDIFVALKELPLF